ncbi:MAG: TolC family protein [Thermoguttaceae bacterium]|nr:TolC family protein [Thermoguttaceae bacterium]
MQTKRTFCPASFSTSLAAFLAPTFAALAPVAWAQTVSDASVDIASLKPVSAAQAYVESFDFGQTTVAALQEFALSRHPSLRLVDDLTDAERGVYVQSGLLPNPTLRYGGEEIGADGSAGKHGVSVEQEFGGGARRRLAQEASRKSLAALDWERQVVATKIRNDVRAAAYRLLVAQKRVEFRQQIASVSQAAEDASRALLDAGGLSRLNFIQLQNQTREANLATTKAKNAKAAAQKALLAVLGAPNGSVEAILDDPEELGGEPLDENATLDDILERSPEIERLRAQIVQRQAVLNYERAPKREFSVEGGVSYAFGESTTLASAGVGVPLRINDRNQGNIQRATAEYFAAQRELERTQLKLRAEFAETFAVYKSAREEVRTYREEIMPSLETFFEMSQQAFLSGEIDFLEISQARVVYIESSVNYLDALERLAESIVKLEGALLERCLGD